MKEKIAQRLSEVLMPKKLIVIDQSHLHHSHFKGDKSGGTHFRVEITSAVFKDKLKVQQHKLVYNALQEWMNSPIHALQLILSAD